jgi:flagellar hook-associated protein 3 FlgL
VRVTDQQFYEPLFNDLQQTRARILSAQEQVSSGLRVAKPSDDPSAFGEVVRHKAVLSKTQQVIRNIQFATARLDIADSALTQASNLLARAKELAVRARSDTNTSTERTAIAQEVRQIHRQLVGIANTEANGQTVFAGTRTDVSPFVITVGDTVVYQGNGETQSIEVESGQTVQVTIPGSQVFAGPTANVFDGLRDLLAALETNNGSGIAAGIADVDLALTQVSAAHGQIGAFASRLQSSHESVLATAEITQRILSEHGDADLVKAVSDLQRHQVSFEATSDALGRLLNLSLLTFLR